MQIKFSVASKIFSHIQSWDQYFGLGEEIKSKLTSYSYSHTYIRLMAFEIPSQFSLLGIGLFEGGDYSLFILNAF